MANLLQQIGGQPLGGAGPVGAPSPFQAYAVPGGPSPLPMPMSRPGPSVADTLLRVGLGIMGANQPGASFSQAVGQGALTGLQQVNQERYNQQVLANQEQQMMLRQIEMMQRSDAQRREAARRAEEQAQEEQRRESLSRIFSDPTMTEEQRAAAIRAAMPLEAAEYELEQAYATPELTSLQRNIEYMQRLPEGDPRREMMQEAIMKPATSVTVGGQAPPAIKGMRAVPDPTHPSGWRYVPVGGAPEEGLRPEERAAQEAQQTADFAIAGLDRLENLIQEHGTEPLPGGARPRMESAVERAVLTVKDVLGMGALQGQEREMLENLIGDPTEALSSVRGREAYLQKLDEARKLIEDRRRIFGGEREEGEALTPDEQRELELLRKQQGDLP